MNNLKFRAYIKSINKVVDVLKIDFKSNTLLLDIDSDEMIPKSDYWWYETTLSFEDVVLMQSTGFHDKNGVEIFEGDIIDTTTKNKYQIIQSVTGLWKAVSPEDNKTDKELYFLTLADVCELVEVISNIYENKELIENKELLENE